MSCSFSSIKSPYIKWEILARWKYENWWEKSSHMTLNHGWIITVVNIKRHVMVPRIPWKLILSTLVDYRTCHLDDAWYSPTIMFTQWSTTALQVTLDWVRLKPRALRPMNFWTTSSEAENIWACKQTICSKPHLDCRFRRREQWSISLFIKVCF